MINFCFADIFAKVSFKDNDEEKEIIGVEHKDKVFYEGIAGCSVFAKLMLFKALTQEDKVTWKIKCIFYMIVLMESYPWIRNIMKIT